LSEHEHRYVFLRQELAVEIEARLQAWRELLGLREDAEAIRQHLNCIPDTSQAQEREPLPGRVYDAVRDLRAALARAEAAESERDALRRIVDSECPIGALDLVTSLRAEKRQIQEALQAEWAKVEAAEAEVARLREVLKTIQDNAWVPAGPYFSAHCAYCHTASLVHWPNCPFEIARAALAAKEDGDAAE
jgi:tRNA C32,U32 (ribose-2'-O)-methylase TrmJ